VSLQPGEEGMKNILLHPINQGFNAKETIMCKEIS